MTEEAMTYLNHVLDYIQRYSVKREQINWLLLRQEVTALVADAQTTAETYPAIQLALKRLDDHHSHFLEPAAAQLLDQGVAKGIGLRALYPTGIIEMVFPQSPAEQAGVQIGEIITAFDGQAVSSLISASFYGFLRKDQLELSITSLDQQGSRQVLLHAASYSLDRAPQGRRLAHNIGYVQVPELLRFRGEDRVYIETIHRLLQEIDQVATCGWIIDLRHNPGGNLWGMVAALGPLLGEDEWVVFVGPEHRATARYCNGQAIHDTRGVLSQIATPYHLKCPNPPVAVLVGPMTGSSAEFLLLRFYGRPHARSFGEPTGGAPTANDIERLSDGARLHLTKALGIDREGQTYERSLQPDERIPIDWARVGTDDDPVLQAALQWLQTEEECC